MIIAIKNVVDEPVNDGGLPYSLVAEEDDLVLEDWGDAVLADVEVADVHCHSGFNILLEVPRSHFSLGLIIGIGNAILVSI